MQKAKAFLQETRVELGKVTWPTVDDLKVSTKVTMILLAIMSGVIFVYDKVFGLVVIMLLKLAA